MKSENKNLKGLKKGEDGEIINDNTLRSSGITFFGTMVSDTIEEQQPENTYRFALNAMNEDRDTLGRLQNEESNEECIEIEDIVETGILYVYGCCKNLLKKEYNSGNIASIINSLDVDCGCLQHNGYWKLDETENVSTASVISYLQNNIGIHKIKANCVSTYFEIGLTVCEKKYRKIESCSPIIITETYLNDIFNSQIHVPNILIGDENNHIATINGTDYSISDLPVTLNSDSNIKILCHYVDPCDIFSELEPMNQYNFGDGTSIDIEYVTGDFYRCNTVQQNGYSYIAFESDTPFTTSMGIAIYVNNVLIDQKNTYNNNLQEYWYIHNDKIIIKIQLNQSTNSFVFYSKECDEKYQCIIDIRSKIKIYDTNNNEIGYINPSKHIINPNIEQVTINGISSTGIYGRICSGSTIDWYEVLTINGDTARLKNNNFLIDVGLNKKIVAHIA